MFIGGSGLLSARLESWPNNKNNKKKAQVDSVYSRSLSFKKPKKSEVSDTVVDSSTGPLSVEMLQATDIRCDRSWGSEMESEENSVSGLSDVQNLKNTITKKTSYVDSNASKMDDMIDDTTLRKTKTRTYVLEQLPKASFFVNTSDNDSELVLLAPKFVGFNQLPSAELCVLEKQNFKPVKLFTLDVDHSDQEMIIKKIPVDLPKSAIESVFSKFGKVVSIKVQLIGLWQKVLVEFESSEIADLVTARWSVFMEKNSVRIAKAINNKQICTVVCFDSKAFKLAAIGSVPVYKSVNLHWGGLSLACCTKCKQLGHISIMCSLGENSGVHNKRMITSQNQVYLTNIYKKKQTPIVCPVSFGKKTWAQVASSSLSCVVLSDLFGMGSFSGAKPVLLASNFLGDSCLVDQLASLECSLELLTD
ncbi:hypothetical protein G9A89_019058 [Geosiphon pyriformis]|nr:hypothetical protein G9A89_019058 [Geosiphon pyriformis]